MTYKGFISTNIIEENGVFSGTVENSRDYLKFEANDIKEAEEAFHKKVDEYLKKCELNGIDPYYTI